jgi:hypothetical protein
MVQAQCNCSLLHLLGYREGLVKMGIQKYIILNALSFLEESNTNVNLLQLRKKRVCSMLFLLDPRLNLGHYQFNFRALALRTMPSQLNLDCILSQLNIFPETTKTCMGQ